MRCMILLKANADSESGALPSQALLEAMGRYNEELVKAGVMRAGEGLKPTAEGARVRFSGEDRSVRPGPFALDQGVICGFWIFEVASLDEAVDWVKRCPNPLEGEAEIEIRPVFEMTDFGDAMTPELRAQEERMRTTIESKT
ncbi:MAG: dehydrogenase [Rhodospirillales bacterium 69-11]|nr:YciI family protein [Rhodospirillales bacterium]OJW20603.1 MAG: dehydrogenase [Rhodospirillales bacterium 69-11]